MEPYDELKEIARIAKEGMRDQAALENLFWNYNIKLDLNATVTTIRKTTLSKIKNVAEHATDN